jgi:hypothetical protein
MTSDPRVRRPDARRQPESILADDLRVDTRPQTDDDARLQRMVGGAMAATFGVGALWLALRSIATSKIVLVAVATTTVSVATAWVVARPSTPAAIVERSSASSDDAPTQESREPTPASREPTAIEEPTRPAVIAPSPHRDVAAPIEAAPTPAAPPRPRARAEGTRAPSGAPAVPELRGADALLEDAAKARKDGRTEDALATYRELGRRFAGTREDAVGCVALARLLLGRDAADALAVFDRCLADHPRGELVEAALVGRAQALAKLGRDADERAAWAELLRRFPSTLHAEHAKSRIGE